MAYNKRIQRAIDYIEENLLNELSLESVAGHVNFSLFHFHRVFHIFAGCSLKEYIRNRRLTNAAYQLIYSDKRIIDVALEHGYESQESFTRAFQKLYCTTPGRYRSDGKYVMRMKKLDLLHMETLIFNIGDEYMEPKIITRDKIKIAGAELKTFTRNGDNLKQIPQFWDQFKKEGTDKKIKNRVDDKVMYGICTKFNQIEGSFSYIIGREVKDNTNLPPGLIAHTIPAQKYAVYTAKGRLPNSVQGLLKKIYGGWLEKSGYERTEGDEFEYYDERCTDDDNCEVDLYIPVK